MSLTVDLDLTKFEAIVAGTSFDVSSLTTMKPTYTVTAATIQSAIITSGGMGTISFHPDDGSYFPTTVAAWPKQFTFHDFARALHEVVEERGREWRYPSQYDQPWYYHDVRSPRYRLANGHPACLIGAVLDRLDRRMLDDLSPTLNPAADVLIMHFLNRWFVREDLGRIAYAARRSQQEQDRRETWGEAENVFHSAAAGLY